MAERVIDKAITAHGAAGVSQDFPLAYLWANARPSGSRTVPTRCTSAR